jgi:hypothetical protein
VFYSDLESCLEHPTEVTTAEHAGRAENAERVKLALESSPEQLRQLAQKEEQDESERERHRQMVAEEAVCAAEYVQTAEQQAEALAKEQFAGDGSGLSWEQLSPEAKGDRAAAVKAARLWCHPAPPAEPPKFPLFENYKPDNVAEENLSAAQAAWQRATAIVQSICVKEAQLLAEADVKDVRRNEERFALAISDADYPDSFYATLNICLEEHGPPL